MPLKNISPGEYFRKFTVVHSTPPRQARQDHVYLEENGEFKQQRRPQLRKRPLNGTVALLQTFSCLFHLVQFVKCWQFFLELNSKRVDPRSRKQKEIRCLVFTSSTKREVRYVHVVVIQWRQRNVQKSVMHVQGCCFANLNLSLFWRSRWRRRRRCLIFLIINNVTIYVASYCCPFYCSLK